MAPGGPPRPGDLFVLRATGDLPVEWAVLDQWPEKGELLAVPADQNPLAGSADVEVPAAAPGGPLSLRCRFGAWLAAGLFETALRSGSLAPETVAEALQRVRRIEDGTLEPAGLAEEVDADSEYKDWIREVPERARALARAARPASSRMDRWEWSRLMAAVLALAVIGLGIWVAELRREVERLSVPVFDAPSQQIVLGEKVRGPLALNVPAKAVYVELILFVDAEIPQEGRFEILDAKEHNVWTGVAKRLIPDHEYRLVLSRDRLPDGEYRIRIVPREGGHSLAESALTVTTIRE